MMNTNMDQEVHLLLIGWGQVGFSLIVLVKTIEKFDIEKDLGRAWHVIFRESKSFSERMAEWFIFTKYWYSLVFIFFIWLCDFVFWLWRWMTKSARKGFDFGNHHCCDLEERMNRPAVVLYGKGLDKGRIGGALNHLNFFHLFSFFVTPLLVVCSLGTFSVT